MASDPEIVAPLLVCEAEPQMLAQFQWWLCVPCLPLYHSAKMNELRT